MGVLLGVMACSAAGSELRTGGRAVLVGSALPSAGANAEVDLFADYWNLEATSMTEISLFPYRTGSETIALSLVQDWLSLTAEYEFSIVPLGITATSILAQATPAAWVTACGSFLVDASVEGEARLLGDGFASTPLRAELWVKGTAGIGGSVGAVDLVHVAAALEGTLSAPNGTIWPTPTLIASASRGRATLSSETETSFAGGVHVTAETVSLACSWREFGLSGKAWCTFSEEPTGLAVGLRIAYEFGALPLRPFPDSTACVGGVCH
ncbi:MAG: hypothetical protein NTY63_09140 [Candidatus Bipolaricaulota bacterium]|nr:hypothetical protein [Candidatus Bipolaricaulota bacterium]